MVAMRLRNKCERDEKQHQNGGLFFFLVCSVAELRTHRSVCALDVLSKVAADTAHSSSFFFLLTHDAFSPFSFSHVTAADKPASYVFVFAAMLSNRRYSVSFFFLIQISVSAQ